MLVIDTSVAMKWAVEEQDTDRALELISRSLIAPDLFQAEVGNVLTKKVRSREISNEQARPAYSEILACVSLLRSEPFGDAAFDLSLLLRHSIYDCYFLAAAQAGGHPMVTADAIFVNKVRAANRAPLIYLLGEEIPHD